MRGGPRSKRRVTLARPTAPGQRSSTDGAVGRYRSERQFLPLDSVERFGARAVVQFTMLDRTFYDNSILAWIIALVVALATAVALVVLRTQSMR